MAPTNSVRILWRELCDDTLTLRFERPAGWDFVPGQYFMVYLETAKGREGKPFSHASAPGDPWIEMTTRVSASPFKQTLAEMAKEERVEIVGPAGRFALAKDASRPVFLAGGVGITPVMSMLRDARDQNRNLAAVLFYGNVVGTCIAYEEELAQMEGSLVQTVHVIERPEADWAGESGFICAEIMQEHLLDVLACGYYVTGPPIMVEAMESVLDELAIPVTQRHVERFGR